MAIGVPRYLSYAARCLGVSPPRSHHHGHGDEVLKADASSREKPSGYPVAKEPVPLGRQRGY